MQKFLSELSRRVPRVAAGAPRRRHLSFCPPRCCPPTSPVPSPRPSVSNLPAAAGVLSVEKVVDGNPFGSAEGLLGAEQWEWEDQGDHNDLSTLPQQPDQPQKNRKKTPPVKSRYWTRTQTDDAILRALEESGSLENRESRPVCVFNPGNSGLPDKLLQAGLPELLLLEANAEHGIKWRAKGFRVFQVDFAKLFPVYCRSPDSLKRIFGTPINQPFYSYDSESEKEFCPRISFVGTLTSGNEQRVILNLFYTLMSQSFLFSWGPVEFLLFVSPSEYICLKDLVLHKQSRIKNQHIRTLFDIDSIHTENYSAFDPPVTNQKSIRHESILKTEHLATDEMYLVRLRPKRSQDIRFGSFKIQRAEYARFFFFHQKVAKNKKKTLLSAALSGWFGDAWQEKLVELNLSGRTVGELGEEDYGRLYENLVEPYCQRLMHRFYEGDKAILEDSFYTQFQDFCTVNDISAHSKYFVDE